MPWYSDANELDRTQPIVAEKGHALYLLLPHVKKKPAYNIDGYDWFDLNKGEFNSCYHFKSVEDAIS